MVMLIMENHGEFIDQDEPPVFFETQEPRRTDEPDTPALPPPPVEQEPFLSSGPAKEEEPVILFPRPADVRAGNFLKEWVRRFSRM